MSKILATLIPCLMCFLGGFATHKYLSRPPIVGGILTTFEPGEPGRADPAIYHRVYPESGNNWFSTHSPGMDGCKLCRGGLASVERYDVHPEDRPGGNRP